jgi:hypothetical protein
VGCSGGCRDEGDLRAERFELLDFELLDEVALAAFFVDVGGVVVEVVVGGGGVGEQVSGD